MMDHSLRSISYIADIGNLVVLMAKRRPPLPSQESSAVAVGAAGPPPPSKILCHVFESPEAQLIGKAVYIYSYIVLHISMRSTYE